MLVARDRQPRALPAHGAIHDLALPDRAQLLHGSLAKSGRRAAHETTDDDAIAAAADAPASSPHAIAVAGEARARLGAALARLPEEQRVAFLLYVEGGLSVAEIAEQTGAGAETAKSRLRYAVARLKEALGDDAPAD